MKDPDGSGVGAAPVEVFCDMKTGTTRIDHDLRDQVSSKIWPQMALKTRGEADDLSVCNAFSYW